MVICVVRRGRTVGVFLNIDGGRRGADDSGFR